MLPRVISESRTRSFKFWFDEGLQDGMHYANELYFRSQTQAVCRRAYLYQVACRLADQGADVLVTVSSDHCSLWLNLRNQKSAAETLGQYTKTKFLSMFPPDFSTID